MIFDSDQVSDACIKQHIYGWIWPIHEVAYRVAMMAQKTKATL